MCVTSGINAQVSHIPFLFRFISKTLIPVFLDADRTVLPFSAGAFWMNTHKTTHTHSNINQYINSALRAYVAAPLPGPAHSEKPKTFMLSKGVQPQKRLLRQPRALSYQHMYTNRTRDANQL